MRAVLFITTALAVLLTASCGSSTQKAEAPPKPGTLAYDWYAANENWKKPDYPRAMDYLSRLVAAQSEYRERARVWQIVVAGGVAQGYNELANEYEKSARTNPTFRRQMQELRNAANVAAMQFAGAIHDTTGKNKDAKIEFEFGFPTGSAELPLQFAKVTKGLAMQEADFQVVRQKMAERGVVKFAAALAGSPDNVEKARSQFASAPKPVVLASMAKALISTAELYSQKKLDIPQRGNALVREAGEAISQLQDSKEKKDLEKQAQEALKKYKVAS